MAKTRKPLPQGFARYEVITGQHVQQDYSQKPDPKTKRRPSQAYGVGAPGGRFCLSETDLVLRHGANKFRHVEGEPKYRTPPSNLAYPAPGGQVHDGIQETSQRPDGTMASGPLVPGEEYVPEDEGDTAVAGVDSEGDSSEDTSSDSEGGEGDENTTASEQSQGKRVRLPVNFNTMTKEQLKDFAEKNQIDLGEVGESRAKMVEAIRTAAKR